MVVILSYYISSAINNTEAARRNNDYCDTLCLGIPQHEFAVS